MSNSQNLTTASTIRSWQGYLRSDGRKGVRNLVLVIYTVECASFVAQAIAKDEPDVHVIGFPGCYDNAYAIRLMLSLARHPNVGAVLSVGLGCEYTQPHKIAEVVRESGRPAEGFFIQDIGGTTTSTEHGKQIVNRLRQEIESVPRVSMQLSDLTIGCECGGSDATSGLVGNPVVGRAFDRLVEQGGTAVFEEVVELIGLKEILANRAKDADVRKTIEATYDKAMSYCQQVQQWSTSPGNFAGGLTTIEEKSLGAFAKSGSRPIEGVIKVSEQPDHAGLWLLDSVPDPHFMQHGYTNANDSEGILDLIATGAQIVLFVTGRGSVIGCPVAPLIKITGNTQTYEKLREDMDFNAGRVLQDELTLDDAADELLQLISQVASGKPSKPEALGHREFFIPYKHQDTPPLTIGCRS
ncbi:(2R)-sulfolactate sulfo-lyase subunit beta [Planctomycetes bacterium CA13]|uniref:(2R)-sulfolactate sulfo-lyase subunit beta n=1 Tax=Novipirellula herctigrandis TaxID=2527986 RepID=A0A5C5Z944_9BACT|nr:(2R)-sulfolactate sulfo-lyase subunit beta [Planctomycetes bacterium CA13]